MDWREGDQLRKKPAAERKNRNVLFFSFSHESVIPNQIKRKTVLPFCSHVCSLIIAVTHHLASPFDSVGVHKDGWSWGCWYSRTPQFQSSVCGFWTQLVIPSIPIYIPRVQLCQRVVFIGWIPERYRVCLMPSELGLDELGPCLNRVWGSTGSCESKQKASVRIVWTLRNSLLSCFFMLFFMLFLISFWIFYFSGHVYEWIEPVRFLWTKLFPRMNPEVSEEAEWPRLLKQRESF